MKKVLYIFILFISFFTTSVFAQEITFVQFSDIHLDTINKNNKVRKFEQSVTMFQKAIIKVNAINPALVIFSGDMVNRPKESEFDIFLKNAKKLNMRFYPALGNHDVGVGGGLSKSGIVHKLTSTCDWLHIEKPYYYDTEGEYIFIFLDGTSDNKITSQGYFKKEVLNFLDTTLTENPYKMAIIVQHFPLIEPIRSQSHEVINKQEYFNVIDKHNNVIMVISGHYHMSKATVRNNVLYISTPSLIEYPHAFRSLTVDNDNENITITSELIVDEEQNSMENTVTPYAKLKLGMKNDNDFTVTLKNNIPEQPRQNFFERIKF